MIGFLAPSSRKSDHFINSTKCSNATANEAEPKAHLIGFENDEPAPPKRLSDLKSSELVSEMAGKLNQLINILLSLNAMGGHLFGHAINFHNFSGDFL